MRLDRHLPPLLAASLLFALPQAGTAVTPAGAPSLDELRAATFHGLEEPAGAFTLAGGHWEGEPYAPSSASRPTVALADGFRVPGDLDGDGAEEAIVLLAASSGGSGTFDYLAVVKRTARGVENVATAPLGDRVQIRSARIVDQRLRLAVVRAGKGDASCCPGELAELEGRLDGSRLAVTEKQEGAGQLTADVLAGSEWVLRAWDLHDPAPEEPAITLAFAEGRIAGSSGCNRYVGQVKPGASPGAIRLGPVSGTDMACSERRAELEARFLGYLAGVERFGFHLGRLALSYAWHDGRGTLLFEARPSPPAR